QYNTSYYLCQLVLSCGSLFDLNSAYLTAAFVEGLQIRVQGFVGTSVVYDNTYVASTNAPTLIDFNYFGIDNIRFVSMPSSQFVMDNLGVTVTNGCTNQPPS